MPAALVAIPFFTMAGVVFFTTLTVVLLPVFRFAVVVAVPIITTRISGAECDGNTRRLYAYIAKVYIDIGGLNK